MAQYIAFSEGIDVFGGSIAAFINSVRRGRDIRLAILKKHGILFDIKGFEDKYYPQQNWLDAFKEMSNTMGDLNLFLIGRNVIESAQFPPLNNLHEALSSVHVAYHMNHKKNGVPMFNPQTGEMLEGIGSYLLTHYDEAKGEAIMVCNNPYPSKFDEGVIDGILKRFKPDQNKAHQVKLDITKERRDKGGDSCTYLISW